ncbi:MAG: hypothetical protein U9N78_08175 [Actinomycetota bacterium]|nr:hypothetical protein [Actinomycetota bacterium]
MTVIGATISLVLSLVFAAAVYAHVTEPTRVAAVAHDLGLPRLVAWLAAGCEAGLVLLLIASPELGGLVTATYLAALMAIFGVAWLSGREIADCGCFKSKHAISARWYARNLLLTALALVVALAAPTGLGLRGLTAAAAAAAVTTMTLVASSSRLEAERTMVRTRTEVDQIGSRQSRTVT